MLKYRVTTDKISSLFKKYKSNEIKVNKNQYQRNIVWNDNSKRKLIDSLLDGYMIPPLIFVEIKPKNDEEDSYYEIIDGQQRLTTIISAIESEFTVSKELRTKLGNKEKYLSENKKYLRIFKEIHIPYLILYCSMEKAREIFTRMNSYGSKLNKQEIRWAKYNGRDVYKMLDALNENKDFIKFINHGDSNFVVDINHNRKKDHEVITSLYRLFVNKKILSDEKKLVDIFFDKYEFNEKEIEKFSNWIYGNYIEYAKVKNEFYRKFYYFYIFCSINFEMKVDGAKMNDFYDLIEIEKKSTDSKTGEEVYNASNEKINFAPNMTTRKDVRERSINVLRDFIKKR